MLTHPPAPGGWSGNEAIDDASADGRFAPGATQRAGQHFGNETFQCVVTVGIGTWIAVDPCSAKGVDGAAGASDGDFTLWHGMLLRSSGSYDAAHHIKKFFQTFRKAARLLRAVFNVEDLQL